MPLILHVDTARWRDHLKSYAAAHAGLVPVVKGNGYGFGTRTLATEAAALGADTLAVGTYDERDAAGAFNGDVLVLAPWRPGVAPHAESVIHTVSRLADLNALAQLDGPPSQAVVEVMTTMRRHGIAPDEIAEAARLLDGVRFRGWALHLPLDGDRAEQARTLGRRATAAVPGPLWVSHLDARRATALADELSTEVRLRIGTALWLDARSALQARATVLDVHELSRGDRYGYRQRRAPRAGRLLVVAGGTAHGIALEAPTPAVTVRQRAVSLARGGLEAAGRALSPFYVAGRRRWFAEPPHMQCSMIWVPRDVPSPAVGDELDVDVRFTTTAFDEIRWA